MIFFFFFFSREYALTFHAIVSLGDNLHEMLKPIFWEKEEKYFKMLSDKIYPAC